MTPIPLNHKASTLKLRQKILLSSYSHLGNILPVEGFKTLPITTKVWLVAVTNKGIVFGPSPVCFNSIGRSPATGFLVYFHKKLPNRKKVISRTALIDALLEEGFNSLDYEKTWIAYLPKENHALV